ncbi:hypothetical protein VTL71DRAFT_1497, partial [Oculimacula yallundae]
STNFSN